MAMSDTIAEKIKAGLSPQQLDVQDVSHEHAGHVGWRHGGETHFKVRAMGSHLMRT